MGYALPGFDALLNDVLTDYRNQFDGRADTSEGSLVFIRSACLASALWGLYQHQAYIARQVFPDTADDEHLEHHGWVRGIGRKVGESTADYLARILDDIRRPPAGGNRYDYEKWAKEVAGVKAAYAFPLVQGPESVDVIIVAQGVAAGGDVPTQELLDAVASYIEGVRPVGARFVRVLAPAILNQDVAMEVSGTGLNTEAIQADIETYLNALVPGQPLYVSRLAAIAIENGADDATVSMPSTTVTPESHEMIRPGEINVG